MSDDSAFTLTWDPSHLGDDEFDTELVKFDGWDRIPGLITAKPISVPEPLYFEANVETLKTIDYPTNDVGWPIISQRMRDALASVGEFARREIRVLMLDDTVRDKYDTAGNLRPGVAVEGFAAVQLTQHVDAFDWEQSEYTPDDQLKGRVLMVDRLVLKDVPLPPVFRLSALPGPLFVSAAARAALERAGIRGVVFEPLSHVM